MTDEKTKKKTMEKLLDKKTIVGIKRFILSGDSYITLPERYGSTKTFEEWQMGFQDFEITETVFEASKYIMDVKYEYTVPTDGVKKEPGY